MHMIFQSQSSPILPLAYRAIFTNFYRVDFNNFCFFCAKQAYKKHVFENCICSCTFYYYILSKLLSNLALGHNYIEKSENTNWCQKASSDMGNYNFTNFHQNQMKNKKVLLIAHFSDQNFKVSVELCKSYIVGIVQNERNHNYWWVLNWEVFY